MVKSIQDLEWFRNDSNIERSNPKMAIHIHNRNNRFSQPQVHPRSLGFWKNEFCAALGSNKNQQNLCPATLQNYLDQIAGQSRIFRFTGTQKQKLTQAFNILQISHTNMENKLKAQLLALWLNYVAGWTAGYTAQGMTAKQIITGSENALISRQTQKYGYWEGLCESFNTKWDN